MKKQASLLPTICFTARKGNPDEIFAFSPPVRGIDSTAGNHPRRCYFLVFFPITVVYEA